MSADKHEYEKMYFSFVVAAAVLLIVNLYYFCHPFLRELGLTSRLADLVVTSFRPLLLTTNKIKVLAILLAGMSVIIRVGKHTETAWWKIILVTLAGGALYFLPLFEGGEALYLFSTATGFAAALCGLALLGRRINAIRDLENDPDETFEQCDKLISTPDSVNIPTKYKWKGRMHKGWINLVNIYRGTLILGTPGSGKSFSVYNPIIEQTMAKGFTALCYDYKFPDLSEVIFNELRLNVVKGNDGKLRYRNAALAGVSVPEFYIINFDDPTKSNRCNPIKGSYFKDVADASEVADVIYNNVCPGQKQDDFFVLSAKEYIGCVIYYLATYENRSVGIEKGALSTVPHFIELIGKDYKRVFEMLMKVPELENKMAPFRDAFESQAQDQLQGQIASARIPLNKMASPDLYWVLSDNDFDLDINNPDEPKVVCIGNNPDRQSIYGTALALFTSRLFKLVNHKHKRKSVILLDELPTIFLKGIDNLIATARSNRVAIVLGAQDKTQLIRDYKKENADVVFNTVGNVVAGQVNGSTAQDLNRSFGKEKRRQQSRTQSTGNDSSTVSFHDEELMPISKIETLTQGYFFGKVADNNDTPIKKKLFCGEIQRNVPEWNRKTKEDYVPLPKITSFHEADIHRRLQDPELRHKYMLDYAEEILEKDPAYIELAPEMRDSVYNGRINAILRSITPEEEQKYMDEVEAILVADDIRETIQENFFQIKDDIQKLLDREAPPKDEDEDPMDEEDEQ